MTENEIADEIAKCQERLLGMEESPEWAREMMKERIGKLIIELSKEQAKSECGVKEIANEIGELLERKNHDYGNSVHSTYEDYGMTAFLVRIQDKVNRLKTLQNSEQQVADEKIEDTLKDIAGYAILALNELRNK